MKQILFTMIVILTFCFAAFAQKSDCPEISFVLPNQFPIPIGEPYILSAKVADNTENKNFSYEWAVSTGEILKGQGTSKIELLARRENSGSNIYISVKVIGLPKECSDTYSDTIPTQIILEPHPIDTIGKVSLDDYKARLDGFRIALARDPNSEALIDVRLNKKSSPSSKIFTLRRSLKALIWLKIDLTRVTFAVSEDDFEERTILWVFSSGVKFPDCADENCKIIKAEELKQKISELFPKK